jgi:hypothetical protein
VILGSNALGPYGAEVYPAADAAGTLVLQRHGASAYRPPQSD